MKGKSIFTKAEAEAISILIRKKIVADRDNQKKLRDKIRAIGFYASDFGIGGGYNVNDFLKVVKVIGVSSDVQPASNSVLKNIKPTALPPKKTDRDETYVINLCDELLKSKGWRQHRFDFLKGDNGTRLPVDAYYEHLKLVVEYRERQHTEQVKFFDRRQTVSGVPRGEQRKMYDQRRRDVMPKHGITLIEIGYDDFEHDRSKRLIRNRNQDIAVLKMKLKKFLNKS